MQIHYTEYMYIVLGFFLFDFLILVIVLATKPRQQWRIKIVAKQSINGLVLDVFRRGILSAVYSFGGSHALLIFYPWFAPLGFFAVLISPFAGLLHSVLIGLAIISMRRIWPMRQSLLFYVALVSAGTLVYAVADYIVLRLFAPDMMIRAPYQFMFWCSIWGIWGAIVSSRLCSRIRQHRITMD